MSYFYPIGSPNTPWGDTEKQAWLSKQVIQREVKTEVFDKLAALTEHFEIIQYGALSYHPERYPQFALKSKNWSADKPNIMITGGVHGYETSGVQGALLFAKDYISQYHTQFNFIIVPCVSPWGYEVINRWNPFAVDPNRSFVANSPAEESAHLMAFVAEQNLSFLAHFDLHETTDSDESEFRPALAARDGKDYLQDGIPDGFYLVGDSENPQAKFQKAMIDEVRKVTHIAPPDSNGLIIGAPVEQEGVINYPVKTLGLCASLVDSEYCTTTEVYPDSPKATAEICNQAQVAAIVGGLNYLLNTVD